MKAADIIIYQGASTEAYDKILQQAIDYALISFPFTVNRMGLSAMNQRISNIAKGKLAEGLLAAYAIENGIDLDFTAGLTPFWTRDFFDFSWKGLSWDLKNNFIYHPDENLPSELYLKLPALVPHRFAQDQWAQAGNDSTKAFLFTYMRQAVARKTQSFFSLSYADSARRFIGDLAMQYKDKLPAEEPFSEAWFWNTLEENGGKPQLSVFHRPALVITGICTTGERVLFADTDGKTCFGYARYDKRWYEVRPQGGLRYMDGVLETKIKNATCPVGFLPGFKSLI